MLKAPPLKSSIQHFSVLNSKTQVCSDGGIQKKFDKLMIQHRPNKCIIFLDKPWAYSFFYNIPRQTTVLYWSNLLSNILYALKIANLGYIYRDLFP